jgi:hypothetical protein
MRTRRTGNVISALVGAAAALGCSGGGTVNIGSMQTVGGQLSDYAGSWDGYAEAYAFQPSGSDRVRLTLDAHGQGTLQVGDGPSVPPVTDPTVGYPPGIKATQTTATTLDEGFAYPVHAAQVQSNRIQLGLNPEDLFASWCALQPTMYMPGARSAFRVQWSEADAGSGGYSCAPEAGGLGADSGTAGAEACGYTGSDGAVEVVDCSYDLLCAIGVCTCNADGCSSVQAPASTPPSGYYNELDGFLTNPSTLTGTLSLNGPGRLTVHLQRQ